MELQKEIYELKLEKIDAMKKDLQEKLNNIIQGRLRNTVPNNSCESLIKLNILHQRAVQVLKFILTKRNKVTLFTRHFKSILINTHVTYLAKKLTSPMI